MRVIADKASIPEKDVVDAVITGLNDKSSFVTMLYNATTFEQLQIQLERYEKLRFKLNSDAMKPKAIAAPEMTSPNLVGP